MRDPRFSEGSYIEMLNENQNGIPDHATQIEFYLMVQGEVGALSYGMI